MNIKELHKKISDEKNEVIKKIDLAKSLGYSREYVGQLFKNDDKQISLDKIEQSAKYFNIPIEKISIEHAPNSTDQLLQNVMQSFSIDKNDKEIVEIILKSGRFRSLVKLLYKAACNDSEETEALIGILKVPEIAKTFIE